MKSRARLFGTTVVAALVLGGSAASATAAFPNFTDCPRSGSLACVNIVSRGGSMRIKSTDVPLGESLEIRGALRDTGANTTTFIPPTGTNGVFTRPVQVPGGLLGIDFPIPGNSVAAKAELAGPASALRITAGDFRIRMPLKLKLDNPILGLFCTIGTNSNPINVDLIVGTTSPPGPNRPISGRFGEYSVGPDGSYILTGQRNVDNAFSVPTASSCGLGLGGVNALINLKLGLPSSAGNNTLIVDSNIGLLIL